MASKLKKRGQKFVQKFSRASAKASAESKEHIKENLLGRFSHIRGIRLLIVEWGLLIAALFMLGVAQAVWFDASYAEESFVNGGTYAEATVGRVSSMNPLFATTSSEKVLSRLMFATLVGIDYSGHPGPELAESVVSDASGKVWTMKLREGLMWSDGEPLTVDDVMFTIGLVQNPAVNTIYDANLDGVKVSLNEQGEVVFTLAAGYADFISALTIPVVPRHILADVPVKTLVEAEFSTAPVTSGAFSFNAVQTTTTEGESTYYLSANPYYYLGRPMVNSFAVHTYADREAIVTAVNAGAVTATAELSSTEVEKVSNPAFVTDTSEIASGVFAFFNTSNEFLANVEMRQAIRQGIDMATLREKAPGAQALGYPLLKSQITLSSYPAIPAYDLTAAREKISKLASGREVRINVTTVNSGYLPAVAEALSEQLRALGIESEVTTYAESQDFVANVISKRNYAILLYETPLGADPDLLPYYHSSQAGAAGLNLSNYRNSLVDDLLVGARETLEPALRARKYETFLEYWVADAPAIGIYQGNLTYVRNAGVRAYGDKVHLVTGMDRFSDVTEWAVSRGVRNKTP
ncbi:hypothetical protein IJH33_01485 [Candidatus Saccharibacteria bacterium]|nr:hypothetical protein [Candidatus Saccharibacteria bacterium]